MRASIGIESYDTQWPRLFQEEKARIRGALDHRLLALEHIGSTAVPYLGAKPIIDMMAAVEHLADAQACVGPLQSSGYEYVPEYEEGMPDRRYFHKRDAGGVVTHHLHMVVMASEFWERHLLFRDYLRTHPDIAQEYEVLKRSLADRFGSDREGYGDTKTSFIRSIEERARRGKC